MSKEVDYFAFGGMIGMAITPVLQAIASALGVIMLSTSIELFWAAGAILATLVILITISVYRLLKHR